MAENSRITKWLFGNDASTWIYIKSNNQRWRTEIFAIYVVAVQMGQESGTKANQNWSKWEGFVNINSYSCAIWSNFIELLR